MFLKKAEDVATILLPAFETPSGIPNSLIDAQTGRSKTYSWASGKAILSEYGSIQLEFDYLSNLTGNPVFAQKADKIRDVLTAMEKPEGLYPIYITMDNPPRWGQRKFPFIFTLFFLKLNNFQIFSQWVQWLTVGMNICSNNGLPLVKKMIARKENTKKRYLQWKNECFSNRNSRIFGISQK